MNTNDPSLKLAMARLLPELIFISKETEYGTAYTYAGFRWANTNSASEWEDWFEVTDQEWLYIVHLVEQGLDTQEAYKYRTLVWEQVRDVDEYVEAHNHLCATFNQRALAICKVKGIKLENKQ